MISNKKISGIYMILNIVNGKFYIGSSVNVNKRLLHHKNALDSNRHCNSYLQKSYNKYSLDSFLFSILETCEEKELIQKEQIWLDFHKTYNREYGYNICKFAGTSKGRVLTKEHRQNISKAHLNRFKNMSIEDRLNYTKIVGKRLKGISKLNEEQKIAFVKRMQSSKKWYENPEMLEKRKKLLRDIKSKPVLQFTKEGHFLKEFKNVEQAVISLGKPAKFSYCIGRVCRQAPKCKTYLGFKWKYKK